MSSFAREVAASTIAAIILLAAFWVLFVLAAAVFP